MPLNCVAVVSLRVVSLTNLHNAATVANVFPFFYFLIFVSDEEEVGPWPRGPIFPFRKKALQRPRIFKVKHLLNPTSRPSVHLHTDTPRHSRSTVKIPFCFRPSDLHYSVRRCVYSAGAHVSEPAWKELFLLLSPSKMPCAFKQNSASHHSALASPSQRSQLFREPWIFNARVRM